MSFAVDSNLWIYGFDANSPHHAKATVFLKKMRDGDEQWVITWSIIYEVLRVLTHPALSVATVIPAQIADSFFCILKRTVYIFFLKLRTIKTL